MIGNLFDFPINHQWLVYEEWQKTYGKYLIINSSPWNNVNVLGQHFLILASLQRTTDLFEKRSLNYSDRTRLPVMVELCVLDSFTLTTTFQTFFNLFQNEVGFRLSFLPYGAAWKKYRCTFQEFFPPQSIQEREFHTFFASTA